MSVALFFETVFKWLFLLSLLIMAIVFFYVDQLPEPAFYEETYLAEPLQIETEKPAFNTLVNEQTYTITPLYEYELEGVVVSYHNADSFLDIWHHKRWRDFLNLRDLCVIWGENVVSGVYQAMTFSNDSWTCWASWPDSATGNRFKMNALSNNHLLIDNEAVKKELMASEPGDLIRFKGYLSEYANQANGFKRGTSIRREDTGNGACETVYVTDFEIVKKANAQLRKMYAAAKTTAGFSLLGFLILFFITPVRIN